MSDIAVSIPGDPSVSVSVGSESVSVSVSTEQVTVDLGPAEFHNDLSGRSATGAHPMSAISGLIAALAALQPLDIDLSAIAALTGTGRLSRQSEGVWAFDEDVPWADLSGVPSTFAPSAHTHEESEVTGLIADLSLKFNRAGGAIGTDPGGSELLRVGGSVRAENGIIVGNSGGGSTYGISSLSFGSLIKFTKFGYPGYTSAQVGPANKALALNVDASTIVGGAFSGAANEFLVPRSTAIRQPNVGETDWELAKIQFGELVLGTDPGGSELLRVGGAVRCAGLTSSDTIFSTGSGVQTIMSYGSGYGTIGTNSNHPLYLIANGGQKATLGTDGSFVLGTDPGGSELLRVGGNIKLSGYISFKPSTGYAIVGIDGDDVALFCGLGAETRLRAKQDGSIVIGTDPGGSELLRVGGTARFSGKITTVSAVPASFADLAAVRTWLAAQFT